MIGRLIDQWIDQRSIDFFHLNCWNSEACLYDGFICRTAKAPTCFCCCACISAIEHDGLETFEGLLPKTDDCGQICFKGFSTMTHERQEWFVKDMMVTVGDDCFLSSNFHHFLTIIV